MLVFTRTDERKSMVNWKHVTNMGGRNVSRIWHLAIDHSLLEQDKVIEIVNRC